MSDTNERYQRVNLRLPKDLHAKLQAAADARSRSMNAEVVARLESSFEDMQARIAALEAEVFEGGDGNEVLRAEIRQLEREVEALGSAISSIGRHMR